MRVIIITLLFLCTNVLAEQLTINYEEKPELLISGDDFVALSIKPDGSAVRIGNLPLPIKDNDYDWEAFHKESKSRMREVQYSVEQYREILTQVLFIISNLKPSNKSVSGKGYTSFNIMLWGNPNVEFRFNSIGGKDYPESIKKLSKYIQLLNSPNKSSKKDAQKTRASS